MSFGKQVYAKLRGDRVIWMILAVLAIFSIMAVYSSTTTLAYRWRGGNTEAYMLRHLAFILVALFLAYICYVTHYMNYSKAAPYLLIISIPLLVYTIGFVT